MTKPPPLTRQEMQTEALVVQSLLEAAMALFSANDGSEDMYECIERAYCRAKHLNSALDSVNAPEVTT